MKPEKARADHVDLKLCAQPGPDEDVSREIARLWRRYTSVLYILNRATLQLPSAIAYLVTQPSVPALIFDPEFLAELEAVAGIALEAELLARANNIGKPPFCYYRSHVSRWRQYHGGGRQKY